LSGALRIRPIPKIAVDSQFMLTRERFDCAGLFPQFLIGVLSLSIVPAATAVDRAPQMLVPPFTAPWDIQRARTSVSRVFSLSEPRYVWFEIEFYRTDGSREIVRDPILSSIVGDGSGVYVTEASADTDDPVIVKDYVPGQYRPDARYRMAHTGVMIPVHMRVEAVGDSSRRVVLNKVFKTWNFSHGAERGVSRTIGWVTLDPGTYRVTATTTQDTKLPTNLTTRFVARYPPKK
jgi:hypothetical protein